ncbi:MAG TPA: K(+)-transporting ATPase subunit C [Fibrobacteria bacterium]|nr:K(+)-transporting ATPase subunit C [Fibrobacteria bacterium]
MENWTRQLRISILVSVLTLVLLCGLYPLAVWGISQAVFPAKANGSLITRDGKVVGSELLGQNFAAEKYFHPRPSAAGNGYDAANSGGSNLGPTSQKQFDAVKNRVAAYRKENGLKEGSLIPADAVTASGSGLDPEISPANARLQIGRVAHARGLEPSKVEALVKAHTRGRSLGFLGDPGVNVLEANLALDGLE